jgi:hypothetical protein
MISRLAYHKLYYLYLIYMGSSLSLLSHCCSLPDRIEKHLVITGCKEEVNLIDLQESNALSLRVPPQRIALPASQSSLHFSFPIPFLSTWIDSRLSSFAKIFPIYSYDTLHRLSSS